MSKASSSSAANNNQLTMFSEVVAKARTAFASNRTRDISFRKAQLKAMNRMLDDNVTVFGEALKKDLNKCHFEVTVTEVDVIKNDIRGMLIGIDKWTKPQSATKSIATLFDQPYVYNEPYGLCLVIGAWNYPLQLLLSPLVAAITAGNAAIVKPSEIAHYTAQAIAELLPQYLDRDLYPVVLGGATETQELLRERFDYVFYTGSTKVGRIVNQAVAANLTPVTLELGGKSPCYIDDSVDNLATALKRVMWGKLLNAGQTCIAPDFVLCSKEMEAKIITLGPKVMKDFYGDDPKASPDYSRIINAIHFNRLKKLLDSTSGTIVHGGQTDETDRFIAPTIVSNVSADDALMQEELFGPILPILTIGGVDDAIRFINSQDKPLCLYVFANKSGVLKRFVAETSSGAVVGNDTLLHYTVDTLPFGGVGSSGMGSYHGKYSFETFSHKKAVLARNYNPIAEVLAGTRFPPYSKTKLNVLEQLLYKRNYGLLGGIPYMIMMGAGFAMACAMKFFMFF